MYRQASLSTVEEIRGLRHNSASLLLSLIILSYPLVDSSKKSPIKLTGISIPRKHFINYKLLLDLAA